MEKLHQGLDNHLSERRRIYEDHQQLKTDFSAYMKYLVCDIKNKKEAIIADLVKDVHIVASTADSWCKWKAGLISGTIAKCFKDKEPVVCFMDECESYGLLQTLASASQDFRALVFSGDENLRLESQNALAAITYRSAESIYPDMIDNTDVKMLRHKAEVQEEFGLLWFNKACSSSRYCRFRYSKL